MQAGGGPTGTELAAELNDLVSVCFPRTQMAMPHVKPKGYLCTASVLGAGCNSQDYPSNCLPLTGIPVSADT